ncbi:hypothetical protein GYMLUDRAFT_245395 [Collybiopsis luxurians FD-317 M1]|uniref:Unplaced genomic scaffold GYMLUscaffold_32, whole genome shotgun sequence n=1 Tax=Collybiopsis luxurians FD-317 M1 TaxID=944289 RepID=A0A0D0CA28_9AGAR|nr:hypothetical protein GYMLUDRAFT_245395 [Collybiopsis luxurians FD-317 M1]
MLSEGHIDKLDFDTPKTVESSLRNGILKNLHNSEFNHTARKLNQQNNKIGKQKRREKQNEVLSDFRRKVAESWANTKELMKKLREVTGSKPKTQKQNAELSSCSRAAPIQESPAQVREGANPYPMHAGSIARLPGPEYAPEVLSIC